MNAPAPRHRGNPAALLSIPAAFPSSARPRAHAVKSSAVPRVVGAVAGVDGEAVAAIVETPRNEDRVRLTRLQARQKLTVIHTHDTTWTCHSVPARAYHTRSTPLPAVPRQFLNVLKTFE